MAWHMTCDVNGCSARTPDAVARHDDAAKARVLELARANDWQCEGAIHLCPAHRRLPS